MRRVLLLISCAILAVLVVGGLGLIATFLVRIVSAASASATPDNTPMTTIPTAVPTLTATTTPTLTATLSPTATFTATATLTPSATASPTPTLAVRLLEVVAINPGVTLNAPTATLVPTVSPTPLPTLAVPNPPAMADIPRAVFTPITLTPVGWVRYEDTDPQVIYTGDWQGFDATYRATNHHYTYTSDPTATATLTFLGAGVRVRYVLSRAGGVFEIRIDGRTVATLDSYIDPAQDTYGGFESSVIFQLYHGWHTLEMINTGRKEAASQGTVIGLDAIEIFKSGLPPTPGNAPSVPLPPLTNTPTPAPAVEMRLVVAPPTVQASVTPISPGVIDLLIVIGYDADGNKVIEPSEGVAGVSVRVVRADTNHVVAAGVTDSAGYVHLQALQTGGLLVIVPYLGKSWALPALSASSAGASYSVSYTLLVPPVNEPALIP